MNKLWLAAGVGGGIVAAALLASTLQSSPAPPGDVFRVTDAAGQVFEVEFPVTIDTTSTTTTTTTTSTPPTTTSSTTTTTSQPPSSALWATSHENGLGDWEQTPSGDARAELSTEQAHTGSKSAKLIVGGDGGIRMRVDSQSPTGAAKEDPDNLPTDGLYSAWYYFPSNAAPSCNSNIFQWKQAETKANGTSQTRRLLHFIRADREGNQFRLHLRGKMDHQTGEWNALGQTFSIGKAGTLIPLDTWVKVSARRVWAKNQTGLIQVFLNDHLEIEITNIVTELSVPYIGYPRQWTVNNYNTCGTPNHLFMDDAEIR